jgi:hypothetical protein
MEYLNFLTDLRGIPLITRRAVPMPMVARMERVAQWIVAQAPIRSVTDRMIEAGALNWARNARAPA